jgi:peptide/nickel transport system substrate-binding protein
MNRFLRRVLAAALALAFLACGRALASNPWTEHHVLRFAIGLDPRNLSPLQATSSDELQLERLLFDVLLTYDDHGRLIPDLAERVPSVANGDISRDGTTLTYHLRRDVRWHDGARFTSSDVRFTFDAIMNPRNTVFSRDGMDQVRRVQTPDPYTVVFSLKRPFAPALDVLFADGAWPYGILPEHLLRGRATLDDARFFTTRPIGTGPFKLDRWLRGDRIELRRNDAYFRGRPRLERIVVRIVPDPQTRMIMLRRHEIDWYSDLPPNLFSESALLPGVRTLLNPQNRFLALNLNVTRPPLENRDVRRAIALALDKDALVRTYSFGTARAAVGDIPQEMWAYPRALRPTPYDVAASRALLRKAGWRLGSDGIFTSRSRRLSIQLAYIAQDPVQANLALGIQAQLRAAGVEVEPRAYPSAAYYAAADASGLMRSRRFDLAFSSWTGGGDPDDSSLFACAYVPPAGANYSGYCSSAMDAAQAEAVRSFDRRARKRAYARIEALLLADVPVIALWWPRGTHAYNSDFTGFAPALLSDVWNAERWDI